MARPWIKLYTEALNDPKMILLSDSAYRRFIECLLFAGEVDDQGRIGPLPYIAIKCHQTQERIADDLNELSLAGIVHYDANEWHITAWGKRQPAETVNDRVKRYRESKAKQDSNEDVTLQKRYSNALDKEIEIDIDKEGEGDAHARKNGASAAPSAAPPLPEVPEGSSNHAKTFKAITGFWVGTNMQDFLRQRLGERPDWDTVGWAYEQWITRGYNPRNLRGVLEWYDKRLADPSWQPNGAGQPATSGPDFGQVFEDGFSTFANRRKKMDDADIPAYVIAAVNELGRGRFQNCTDRDKPFLKAEFVKVAAKLYGQVPA